MKRLGELLIEKGHLTQEKLTEALQALPRSGRRLGLLLVEKGFVSEEHVQEALIEITGKKTMDLHEGEEVVFEEGGVKVLQTLVTYQDKALVIQGTSSARRKTTFATQRVSHPLAPKGPLFLFGGIGLAALMTFGSLMMNKDGDINIAWSVPGLLLAVVGIVVGHMKVEASYPRYHVNLYDHGQPGPKLITSTDTAFLDRIVVAINKAVSDYPDWQEHGKFKLSEEEIARARAAREAALRGEDLPPPPAP
ncbi:hypothetical protein H8D30_00495 [bacterium]|nr:hypothetical protein [bacterium]